MSREPGSGPRFDWLDDRWIKVFRDLWGNRLRSLLVVLSIAIGVFCVGMVLGARTIIVDGLDHAYRATNPASATLTTNPFGNALLRSVRGTSGVQLAEARYSFNARIETTHGAWKDLVLFALPNFRHVRLNRVLPQRGAWPPPAGTLLLERTSLAQLSLRTGDRIHIEMPNGRRVHLPISGTAHDMSQLDTPVSGIYYGYITFPTLTALGQPRAFNQLYIQVAGNRGSKAHIWAMVARVRNAVQRDGRHVLATLVPDPGQLWVSSRAQSMLLLLSVLGVFALGMSGFLVVNTVIAQMTAQVQQVGIMKAIGARPLQIGIMYLATILVLAVLAVCVGIPLGLIGAVNLVSYATQLLDFDTAGFGLSPTIVALEIVAGLGVPLLAALVPIVRGSRITVRAAISSYGTEGGTARLGQSLDRLTWLSEPIILGLGNTFRRRGRLALTLVAMILGGAIFIAVLTVRASLLNTMDQVFGYRNYDVQVTFSRPYPAGRVERVAGAVPGVVRSEGWGLAAGERLGVAGAGTDNVAIVAPPVRSHLIKPIVLHGRWLTHPHARDMVVNSDVLTDQPDIHVGSRVRYLMGGHPSTWTVVGIVRGSLAGPIAYVAYPALAAVTGRQGSVDSLQVVTTRHDASAETAISRALEVRLNRAGFAIAGIDTTDDRRAILGANLGIIVTFLLSMAILLAVVGGLGLMGAMVINVLERTREIGIMRAIGASNRDLFQIVLVEGVLIAILSWMVGAILALPLARGLSTAVGNLFLNAPVAYTFSNGGALLWLAGVLVTAILASLLPAWNAARLTVRDVLAYE